MTRKEEYQNKSIEDIEKELLVELKDTRFEKQSSLDKVRKDLESHKIPVVRDEKTVKVEIEEEKVKEREEFEKGAAKVMKSLGNFKKEFEKFYGGQGLKKFDDFEGYIYRMEEMNRAGTINQIESDADKKWDLFNDEKEDFNKAIDRKEFLDRRYKTLLKDISSLDSQIEQLESKLESESEK